VAAKAYAEPEYRAALAVLRQGATRCSYCPAVATSPDHVPPLAEHDHVRVGVCCSLAPACGPCNLARGAAVGNRARRRRSRRRLAPGSGTSARA